MQILPKSIAKALEDLRKRYPFYVAVKRINGRYYLYKETGIWDKAEKKERVISEYLGRITDDGNYIKKKLSAKEDIENAKAIIIAHGGKVLMPDMPKAQKRNGGSNASEIDNKILTVLSMNSRASLVFISNRAGLTSSSTYSRIKSLEKRYDLQYTLDIDIEKLGYMQFLLLIKFYTDMPPLKELVEILGNEPKIQLAIATKGDYDIVAYLLEEDTYKAEKTLWDLRRNTNFKGYDAAWSMTPLYKSFGMVHVRDIFFDKVLSTRVWSRTKNSPRPKQGDITHRDFALLRELNNNSAAHFANIDKINNLGRGAAQYAYHRLKESGIISRTTISMRGLNVKYIGLIFLEFINVGDFDKTWSALRLDIIKNGPILNKYALTGDIESPSEGVLFMPVIDEKEFSDTVEHLKAKLKGVRINTLIGTETISGRLCYRRFDISHSVQHESLIREKIVQGAEKIDYG